MANKEYKKVIEYKKQMLEVVSSLMTSLESWKQDACMEYKIVGKSDKQKVNWKTKEPIWADEEKTIPVYEDIYDYVPIPEEELPESKKAYSQACNDIMKHLERLI